MPDQTKQDLEVLRQSILEMARDEDDRLKPEERVSVRKLIALLPDVEKMIEGRKVWRTIWGVVGELVRWSGIAIGAIIAFKTLMGMFWPGAK